MSIRVGDVDVTIVDRKAGRLVEATDPAFRATGRRIDPLESVVIAVGDDQSTIFCHGDSLLVLHQHRVAHAVTITEIEQARADEGSDSPRRIDISPPDRTRLSIHEIQSLPRVIGRDAHRLCQRCLGMRTVYEVLVPISAVHAQVRTRSM